MAANKTKVGTVAGSVTYMQKAIKGREVKWPEVVDLPTNPILKEKALIIFKECAETRAPGEFSNFELTQMAMLAIASANYLMESVLLEKEGNLLPNPNNAAYFIRNPRIDVCISLNAVRTSHAKTLKLFNQEDKRQIASRKNAFDKAEDVINNAAKHHDLLA